ncbi:hypothetical protein [Streptomyces sp. FxanaA7]|uniref:hypothetical protein n=1 Tax=Streptomyces sp. FxanaA7 TaxID=1265492 RepID=UPI00131AFE22|nr:hypothetical protein [Streptomyces sp. FxanaA7]
MPEFLADPGPPVRGRMALAACTIVGCRYGRAARNGQCPKHRDRWNRAGPPWRPGTHPTRPRVTPQRPSANSPSLTSGYQPGKLFCTGHDDRWHRHGCPALDRFIADYELVGTASIDLRDLVPQLKLEIQYALQCRCDARSRTAAPRLVMPAVRLVKSLEVTSLLDLSEQQWRQSTGPQADESALLLLDARDALEALRNGIGWEIEYPRDV